MLKPRTETMQNYRDQREFVCCQWPGCCKIRYIDKIPMMGGTLTIGGVLMKMEAKSLISLPHKYCFKHTKMKGKLECVIF